MVAARFQSMSTTPNRYIDPPIKRTQYIGITWFTDSTKSG